MVLIDASLNTNVFTQAMILCPNKESAFMILRNKGLIVDESRFNDDGFVAEGLNVVELAELDDETKTVVCNYFNK